jgi:glycosyltransferase involved in cell wall biosynthesis
MSMGRLNQLTRRALLYCTFDGVANCTNGIGRQSQTMLGAWQRRWSELTALTGPFTPYMAIPAPSPHNGGCDMTQLAASDDVIRSRGGEIFRLPYDESQRFWSPKTWPSVSAAAAEAITRLSARYDQVVVVAVDPPFAGIPRAYQALADDNRDRVKILLTMYSTTYIHDHHDGPDPARAVWEGGCLGAAGEPGVYIADIGDFMTRHLAETYRIRPDRLVSWPSSLDLAAPDLQPMDQADALRIVAGHDIPLDRPIILYFGRANPTKGVDLLIEAVRPLRDQVHVVLIAVPDGYDFLPGAYWQQVRDANLRATTIPHFTRDLPRALASLPVTRAVACPSRGEPLANVPFEVALWARHGGPVVVAPARDGFTEQITDGVTGILYDPSDESALTHALARAIDLSPGHRGDICRTASARVHADRDVVQNLAGMLTQLLSSTTGALNCRARDQDRFSVG